MVLFAGISMQIEGHAVILHNEFDRTTGFFKKFSLEKKMRSWAELYQNAYTICIYACNRDIYSPEKYNFTCTGQDEKESELFEIEYKIKALRKEKQDLQKLSALCQEQLKK